MFKRTLGDRLANAATRMPVVTLTGPRQSGKTTLVRAVFPEHAYLSLERPDLRAQALEDPRGLLGRFTGPVILDEVQRAPDLLSYIQVAVDEDRTAGRFVLTGSQNLLLMESVSQTLAGRTALLRLLPLSVAELFERPPFEVATLDRPAGVKAGPAADVWATLVRGFYPRIHADDLDADTWLADYFSTYVERDLRQVLRVMDLDAFERFVRLVAARTGQELSLNELAADAGITQPTAKSWLTALRIGFVVTLLQPHHRSFRKRLRRRPKLHFLDTGLACHLLGIRDAATLESHPLRGALFESYVVAELIKAFENQGRRAPLYHWRDATGHEIDVLIDFGDRVVPVEVKSGITVPPDAVDSLRWWTNIPANAAEGGVLIHGGIESFGLREVSVRPWFFE